MKLIPGVHPKKATRLFKNSKGTNSLTSLILPQSYAWLLEVQICKTCENQTPSFFCKITQIRFSQIRKNLPISLTGVNLSFSDFGCSNLECGILQSKIGCE